MYSNEQKVFAEIVEHLRVAGIPAERIADEMALLIAWAVFGEVDEGVHLRSAFSQMTHRMRDLEMAFRDSCLPDRLSGAAISSMLNCLKRLSEVPRKDLAKCLLLNAQKLGHLQLMISTETGAFLTQLSGSDRNRTVLHYESSVAALPAMDALGQVTVILWNPSPLIIVVSFLMGVEYRIDSAVKLGDPLISAEHVISVPPLQVREFSNTSKLKSDELAVLQLTRMCSSRGVVCVSPSVLFSRAATTVREELINNNLLDAVISLPKGTLLNTAIAPAVLVIDQHRSKDDPIAFVDVLESQASEDDMANLALALRERREPVNGAFATYRDVQKNDYDLTISRYKRGLAARGLEQLKNAVLLDGVAEIVRAQSLKDVEGSSDATIFLEASVRDVTESGRLGSPTKTIHIGKKQLRRAQSQRIYPGDILLAIKGSVGRVAFVDETCGDNWIAGQAFIIIRPTVTSITTPYLYRYLASELIQQYFRESATGTAMAILKAADVSGIPVPLPEPEALKTVEDTHKKILAEYEAIRSHRDTINRLERENWPLRDVTGVSHV